MGAFIIAEAGVNHNGDLGRALDMVEAARAFGADAVKFQTFSTEKVMTRSAEKAEYQKRETGEGSQFDMVKKLELDDAAHRQLAERCRDIGIEFMSTAFDAESHDLLLDLGIQRIKIPSGEITNWPFIRQLLVVDLPIILSTGMATMAEIDDTVALIVAIRAERGFTVPLSERLTILHCTSNYPAAFADVNLHAMRSIADHCQMPIGYSDHTLGIAISTAAVALGATVIEKHFTLDKALPGPDHSASIEPDEFAAMVSSIRAVEAAMGSPIKQPTAAELNVRDVARRSIMIRADVAAGQVLTTDDLEMMRPGTGISPRDIEKILGRAAATALRAGDLLDWSHLQ